MSKQKKFPISHHCAEDGERQGPQSANVAEESHDANATQGSGKANATKQPTKRRGHLNEMHYLAKFVWLLLEKTVRNISKDVCQVHLHDEESMVRVIISLVIFSL